MALQSSKGTCVTVEEVVRRAQARMKELGKNQRQFAEMLGISQPMLSQILAGERLPSVKLLECLKLRGVDHYESLSK